MNERIKLVKWYSKDLIFILKVQLHFSQRLFLLLQRKLQSNYLPICSSLMEAMLTFWMGPDLNLTIFVFILKNMLLVTLLKENTNLRKSVFFTYNNISCAWY